MCELSILKRVATFLFTLSLLSPVNTMASQPTVFHIRAEESGMDQRYDYDRAVLELALQKTVQEYGPYELFSTPPEMNALRAQADASHKVYKNFFLKLSYEAKFNESLDFVPFPIDLGIVGYRVCFVSQENLVRVSAVKNFEDLKTFTYGQGTGWSDVSILRAQGFKVIEVPTYESLFKMVARGRFDLFCRGVNELKAEYEAHQHIEGLAYDTSMAIVYPMPRFFYTHPDNQKAIMRVYAGLVKAYKDGSLVELWKVFYQSSIDFAQLENRKVYRIENPNLEGLDENYKIYFYNPLK